MLFDKDLFIKKLKYLRMTHNLTHGKVAAKLHLERSTYTYYETGKTVPSYNTLLEICQLYGVSSDWLIAARPTNEFEVKLTKTVDDVHYL